MEKPVEYTSSQPLDNLSLNFTPTLQVAFWQESTIMKTKMVPSPQDDSLETTGLQHIETGERPSFAF